MTDNRNTAVIVLSGLSPEEKAKVMREARSFCDKHEIELVASLPAPSQDGTAEEEMQEMPIPTGRFVIDNAKGIHLADGQYYHYVEVIELLKSYAAPLRAEIERLKKDLEFIKLA